MTGRRSSKAVVAGGVLIAAIVGVAFGWLGSRALDEEGGGSDPRSSNPVPVIANYESSRSASTVVTGPALGGSVIVRPGTFDFPARISLDRDPPVEGPPPPIAADPKVEIVELADYFGVDVRNVALGMTGGDWDPPMEVVIDVPASAADVPDSELIACYYFTGREQRWVPVPAITGGTKLDGGAPDGFYISGTGAQRKVHILTRHLTLFSVFRERGIGG